MTRLLQNDITHIPQDTEAVNTYVQKRTGFSLKELACRCTGLSVQHFAAQIQTLTISIVQSTAGKGILADFSAATGAVLQYLGARTVRCEKKTDIAGLQEAFLQSADIIFVADDDAFCAFLPHHCTVIDNSVETGYGFACALHAMKDKAQPPEVLVLGAGPVGMHACLALHTHKLTIAVYDSDIKKAQALQHNLFTQYAIPISLTDDLHTAVKQYTLILDATNTGNFLHYTDLKQNTKIAAPGMPLLVDSNTAAQMKNNLFHEPLCLGIACMTTRAVRIIAEKNRKECRSAL